MSYTLPVTHSNTINTHLSHTLYVKHKFYTITKYLSRNFLSQTPTQSTCLHKQYVHYTCHKLLNPSSKTVFRPTTTVYQTPAHVCQELRRPSVLSRIHPLTKPLHSPARTKEALTSADEIVRDGAHLVVALAVATAEVGRTLAHSAHTLPNPTALGDSCAVSSVLPEKTVTCCQSSYGARRYQTCAMWQDTHAIQMRYYGVGGLFPPQIFIYEFVFFLVLRLLLFLCIFVCLYFDLFLS